MNVEKRGFSNFPLGKLRYVVALLMVFSLIGCAQPEAPEAPDEPAAPDAPDAPEPIDEEPAEVEAPVEGDLVVTSAGFDPAELTVEVGTTLTILSAEGRHKFTIAGTVSPIVEEGSAYDVTFDTVGEVKVFDILSKKTAIVTVEAAETTE